MTVSMDGLRRNAINAYNKLIKEIKINIEANEGAIEQFRIEEPLEDLRNILVTLACSYQEGPDGFAELENYEIDSITD